MKFNTVLFVNATIGFSENLFLVIVAFLENATIGYSLESVCVCVCVCVRAFIPDVAYFLTDVAYFSPDMASFLMWRSMPYQNSIKMTHMVCKPQK